MIILDCLCWIYVVEILPIYRDLEIFMIMYIDLMTYVFWRCMTYIRCNCWWILYMHVVWIMMWRRSVYFLNIYIIRVYYRFNRNRVLHWFADLHDFFVNYIKNTLELLCFGKNRIKHSNIENITNVSKSLAIVLIHICSVCKTYWKWLENMLKIT